MVGSLLTFIAVAADRQPAIDGGEVEKDAGSGKKLQQGRNARAVIVVAKRRHLVRKIRGLRCWLELGRAAEGGTIEVGLVRDDKECATLT